MIINCKICNKEFKVHPCHTKYNKQYCSKKCAGKGRSTYIERKCDNCDNIVKVTAYDLKHQKNKFCSSNCRNNFMKTLTGNKRYNYKEGPKKPDAYGYLRINVYNHPFADKNKIKYHRYIMEQWLLKNDYNSIYLIEVKGYEGKWLSPEIDVHHVDENKLNNDIENLRILTKADHTRLHHKRS